MKQRLFLLVFFALILRITNVAAASPKFGAITTDPTGVSPVVAMYDKIELTYTTSTSTGGAANPYDPVQFDYYAEFWSPSEKHYKVYAFFYNKVTVVPDGNNPCHTYNDPSWPYDYEILNESIMPSDQKWKIRFTPNEIGVWEYRITAKDYSSKVPAITCTYTFTCAGISTSPSNKGFISKANQRYLKFDNGDPYYPLGTSYPSFQLIGINPDGTPTKSPYYKPGQTRERGTCEMKVAMDNMAAKNYNYMRYFANFFQGMNIFGIDYRDGKNYYSRFNQLDSWQLDQIMDKANENGLYLDLMMFSYSDLGTTGIGDQWGPVNPFNSNPYPVNQPIPLPIYPTFPPDVSGTCSTPNKFLTDTNAIKIQKNILRYFVARWGYSNNIMSWELIDEINQFGNTNKFYSLYGGTLDNSPVVADLQGWHINMKNYINSIDPYKHLINTGTMYSDPNNLNLDLINNAMDFTQGKNFTNDFPSLDPAIFGWNPQDYELQNASIPPLFNQKYLKPFFLVEIGNCFGNDHAEFVYDPEMYGLHGLLWSSLFSGAMGPSAVWDQSTTIVGDRKPEAIDNYVGIGNFVKNSLPLLSEDYIPIHIGNNGNGLKIYYLKNINSDVFYGWTQDLNFDFKKILRAGLPANCCDNLNYGYNYELKPPPPYLQDLDLPNNPNRPIVSSNNNSIVLSVGRKGLYDVSWYNTESGLQQGITTIIASTSNMLTINVPAILRAGKYGDAVFKVEYKCAGIWNTSVLSAATASNVLTESDIEASVYGEVFFVGNDNRVHITYHNGFYWTEGPLNLKPGLVRPNSDLAKPQHDQIYYIATDNRVHEYYYKDGWVESSLCQTANIVRANSPLTCDQDDVVYYFATDDKVHNYWFDQVNKVWAEGTLGDKKVHSNSGIAIDKLGNIFFTGQDNRIYRYYWNTLINNWSYDLLDNSAPANVKPGSSITCDATGNVYYIAGPTIGTQGKIQRYKKNGLLWAWENFASGTVTPIKSGSDITVTSDGVFFVGTDSRIHRYWLSGLTWQEAVLNSNNPQNVSMYLTSDLNGNIFYNSNDISGTGNRIFVAYKSCKDIFR